MGKLQLRPAPPNKRKRRRRATHLHSFCCGSSSISILNEDEDEEEKKHRRPQHFRKLVGDKLWVSSVLMPCLNDGKPKKVPSIIFSTSSACPRRRIQMAVILSSSWLKEKELSSDHVNQAVLAASCVDDNNEPVRCFTCKRAKDGLLSLTIHNDSPLFSDGVICFIYYVRSRCSSSLQHCGRREVRVCITLDEKTIMSPPLKIQARVYNALRNEECETYEKITSGMTEDKGKQHLENEESSSPFLDSSDDSTSAPGSISSTTVSPDADYGNTDQLSVPTLFIQNKPNIFIIVRLLATEDFQFGAAFLEEIDSYRESGRIGFSWRVVTSGLTNVFVAVTMYTNEIQATDCLVLFSEVLNNYNSVKEYSNTSEAVTCKATFTNW